MGHEMGSVVQEQGLAEIHETIRRKGDETAAQWQSF